LATTIDVRWDDFEAAFFIGSPDARYFLNRDTGAVEYTSHMDGETVRERILRQTKNEPWIEIPRVEPGTGIRELHQFTETVSDETHRNALLEALKTPRPLVSFNKALGADPAIRKQWKTALMNGIHRRLLSFCVEHELRVDDERFRDIQQRLAS